MLCHISSQESGLLSRILSNEFPESVHERMLVALKDMMMAEEHRLEDNAAMQVGDRIVIYSPTHFVCNYCATTHLLLQ